MARINSSDEVATSIIGAMVLILISPRDRGKPSSQAYAFLLCTVGLPLLFVPIHYGSLPSSTLFTLQIGTLAVFVLIRVSILGKARQFVTVAYTVQSYVLVVATLGSAIFLFLIVFYGLRPELVSFDDVYDRRDEYGDAIGALGSYLMAWLVNGIRSIILAIGIGCRRWFTAMFGLAGFVLAYSLTGFKSYIIGMALILAAFVVVRVFRAWRGGWFIVLTCAVWGSYFLDRLTGSILWTSLFVRRAISTGGNNTAVYFEYFSVNEKYLLRQSVLSFLGESPYPSPPAGQIGRVYSASGETIANANIVADGYANFGLIGCILAGGVIGLFLRMYDSAAIRVPIVVSVPAISMVLIAASNTAVLTMLLTHGGLVVLVLVALIPSGVSAVGKKLVN